MVCPHVERGDQAPAREGVKPASVSVLVRLVGVPSLDLVYELPANETAADVQIRNAARRDAGWWVGRP